MAASTETTSAFPSPYAIETPPGCEGWEEMYPYHALFHEARRDVDESRFWFWNSMHFPLPMPAFDMACVDSPYQALGVWQNRVFAVPPAMGIDYRVVNGYVYITGNPVTDPGEDRRARGVLPAARGLLLRALGRALREVQGEDAGADRRDHGPPRPRAAGVRGATRSRSRTTATRRSTRCSPRTTGRSAAST